jgi:hypothetical protein
MGEMVIPGKRRAASLCSQHTPIQAKKRQVSLKKALALAPVFSRTATTVVAAPRATSWQAPGHDTVSYCWDKCYEF